VPTLQLKDGTALIESMAIIEYLDEVHPQPKLFPGSAVQRAQIRGFCEIVNSGIHPYQNIRLLDKIEADFKADKMAFAKYFVFRGLDTMEKMLARSSKKYCFGDELTAADVFLYPQALASVNRFGAVLSNYQNIDRVMTSLKKIPEFVQAEPQNQQDFEK
jgi:maleylacetoacetate isomerase